MIHFRIKELCKEKGILLQDLAESVEISRVSLTRIIQNQQNPTLLMLEKLAKALDVKVSELFGDPEDSAIFACPKCGAKLNSGFYRKFSVAPCQQCQQGIPVIVVGYPKDDALNRHIHIVPPISVVCCTANTPPEHRFPEITAKSPWPS